MRIQNFISCFFGQEWYIYRQIQSEMSKQLVKQNQWGKGHRIRFDENYKIIDTLEKKQKGMERAMPIPQLEEINLADYQPGDDPPLLKLQPDSEPIQVTAWCNAFGKCIKSGKIDPALNLPVFIVL